MFFSLSDSLQLSSALSVGLAVLFVVVTAAIAVYKLIAGTISMPKLFPELSGDASTVLSYFSVVPILVTAYICHHCGKSYFSDILLVKVKDLLGII
mgnify:CR=1 FL=1